MKVKASRLAALGAAAAALAAVMPASAADQIKLRVADSFPTTHWISVNITRHMMQRVNEITDKAVEFEYYPAEQLGKAKDLLSLANSGVADIAYVAPAFVGEKMPLSVVGELPLPTNSPSACPVTMAYWQIAKPGGVLDQREFAPNGVRLLFTIVLPPYQMATKPKFASLKDVSGMKVRTTGAPKELALRKLGAVPVQIPSPEINEAMSRGTVDGALMPIGSIPSYGLDTVVKHFTVGENFGSFVANYVISERKWKSLPANVQKALTQLGPELSKRGCEMADREEEANVKKLQQAGAQIVTLTGTDKSALREMQNGVGSSWAEALDKRGKPGTEILKAFTAAIPK
jgi:TRAP-type C4-dicarboxylate transport system substrate-binding protein